MVTSKNNIKRIVISCNSYWYAFNFRASTITHFKKLGFEVFVVAPRDKYYGSKVHDLGARTCDIRLIPNGTNPFSELISVFSILLSYRKLHPDCVLHFTPKNTIYGTFSAWILGIKCINNISGRGKVFSKSNILSLFVTFLYKKILNKSSHIFFKNNEDKIFFEELGVTSAGKLSLISGSGVDVDRFGYRELSVGESISFLMFGRLLSEKGVDEFLEAAKHLSGGRVRFSLVGFVDQNDPLLLARIKKAAAAKYIDFKPPVDDVFPIIVDSHCVVLPSYYSEGIPKSLIEGLSVGRPIITTDNIEVFNGNNGFLIEPRSTKALVAAIEKFILLCPDEMRHMGRESRGYAVSRFDQRNMISEYEKVVFRTISSGY